MAKSLGSGEKKSLPGRRNSYIATISIAVSVVVMIVAVSVSDGFSKEIGEKVSGFTGDISIRVPGEELTNSTYPLQINDSVLTEIEGIKGVNAVQGIAWITGVIKFNDQIEGVMLKGVDSSYDWSFVQRHFVKENMVDSLFVPDLNLLLPGSAVISKRLASQLGINVGDRPFFHFIGESVKTRRFTVSAIFDARLENLDKGLVICNIGNVRDLLGWDEESYSSVEVLLDRGAGKKVREKKGEEIESVLERGRDSDFRDFELVTPNELFPHLFDWLGLLDFNVFIVLALMMAVAGFNMVSGLLIILFEKISMIGLLKSLGMRDSSIHRIFLYRALTIVIRGIAAGNIIAISILIIQERYGLISLNPENYFVTQVPVHLNFVKILILDLVAIVTIATILYIPARFISKIEPDKSLRQK